MLEVVYSHSPREAIMQAYPGMFKIWEFNKTPIGYWNGDSGKQRAVEATRWMAEEKLGLQANEAWKIKRSDFLQYGLSGMLDLIYSNSPNTAISEAYPGMFVATGKRKRLKLAV